MAGRLPLSTLLSQALVAFIIEFDNEFEHQAPHQTTNHASTPGAPWLVSMVMWSRFLRFVPDEGIAAKELQSRWQCGQKEFEQWLTRLVRWWGYLTVDRTKAVKGAKRFSADDIVRPRPGSKIAFAVWRPLTNAIEKRWQERFGRETIDRLREALGAVAGQLDPSLPDSLPILGYGLVSSAPGTQKSKPVRGNEAELSLAGLLSKVLLAFAIEFERESELSLAIAANVLRFVGDEGVRVKELPRMAGVSKEAIAMAISFLEKRGYAVLAAESASSRVKVLALTAKGRFAQQTGNALLLKIEEEWRAHYGEDTVNKLCAVLEELAGKPGAEPPPLMAGLRAHSDCWRASLPAPETLPHYPMILHRGGFPDGS